MFQKKKFGSTRMDEPKAKKKMLVICPYPRDTGAGQRMKYEPYIPDWEENGWQVDVSSFMTMSMWRIVFKRGNLVKKAIGSLFGMARRIFDFVRIGRYDLVYIYMWVTPFGGTWAERLVRYFAKSLIYDIEDNVIMPPVARHPLVPAILSGLMDRTKKVRFLAQNADAVVVASPFLVSPVNDIRARNTFLFRLHWTWIEFVHEALPPFLQICPLLVGPEPLQAFRILIYSPNP